MMVTPQPALQGLLAVMLVKFFMNDLPHAAGLTSSHYSEPPTSGQLRYIAALTQRLGIPEPHVETFGEAGLLIRELKEEEKHRKQPKSDTSVTIPALTLVQAERIKVEVEQFGFETLEQDVSIGLASSYPKCDVQYYINSRVYPWLPRWSHPKRSYIVCPACAEALGAKSHYTWEEAMRSTQQGTLGFDEWEKLIEEEHRGLLEGSNPHMVERTILDVRIVDALEQTWHRIESDMSTRMQSSLNILKEMMGHYYEQPIVVVWEGSNLVGAAVYETLLDKDTSCQSTHIFEIASFTHEPGIGRMLIDEIVKIAQEGGSDAVTASHGPGAKEFYERQGFVRDTRYPGAPTLMAKWLKSGNPGLTEEQFCSLPVGYHGFESHYPSTDMIYVTPDEEMAKTHGRYTMVGRMLPEKLIPDPEMEGFAGKNLSGIESFNMGSAIIPKEYYWPDSYSQYLSGGSKV